MSEEEKLLTALPSAAIKEFIDIKKLANSEALIKASEFAASHAVKHGDRIHIEMAPLRRPSAKHLTTG